MNTNSTNTSNTSKKALIVLFVLFLFSSVSMLGQTKETVATASATTTIEVVKVSVNPVALDSDVELMNWFMSSKQIQSVGGSESTSSTNASRKKQIISSGVVPNKVLYRTLVKKVISQENAIA